MSMHTISAADTSSHYPRITKRITDIFRSSQKCILIEGAPGIGKTVLSEEIAYCWANGEILNDMKLFLIFVRDPNLHHVNSINKLVYYLGSNCLNDSEVKAVADKLRRANGSNTVLVIDGYDECPCNKPLKGFIDKLCQGDILPQCMIVITSRPTASLLLHPFANQRIEILGLAKKEQEQYIKESLKSSPEMKIRLKNYLKQQPIINSLIYVPLHLAILLYLFKQDYLPETLTEMNELFIMHTIYRNLSKAQGALIHKVKKVTDLPKNVLNVIKQLSKLAFEGLLKNQLVFMEDEIDEVCPEVHDIPGAINGFGLLQTVQHYCKKGAAGTDMSFVFLHFTMQEFLAAFYVSALQNGQQSLWIKRSFWDSHFNFMWMMYVGIVGVKSECVTKLIHSFDVNCKYNLQYKIKECLHLFQCYLEAKDAKLDEMPEVISSIFNDGNISFYGLTSLLPNHVTSLTYYMMKSRVKWKSINLRACNICDDGMRILQQFFINFQDKATLIKDICLSGNNLSSFFGSQNDINQEAQVETNTIVMSTFYSFYSVNLSNNHICYNGIVELANVNVQKLDISHNKLSDNEARAINECLKKNTTIQELDVSDNAFNNEGAVAIFEAISVSTTLRQINIAGNNVSNDATEAISSSLTSNKTLLELNISKNLLSKEGVMRIVKACTINRTLYKLVCTHNNLSKSGLAAINEYIRKENAVQIFDASWNAIGSKRDHLGININFQQIDMTNDKPLHTPCNEIWSLNEISFQSDNYKHQLLNCCLENPGNLGISKRYILQVTIKLISLDVLQHLDISCNNISDEGAKELAVAIKVNKTLQELNISKNWISKEGVMTIVEACTINRTLHRLVCTHNNLSKSGLAAINEYIRKENAVKIFDASWNTIATKDGQLAFRTAFQILDMGKITFRLSGKSDTENMEELWFCDEIGELRYMNEFLQCCIEEIQHLNVQSANLSYMTQMGIISDGLNLNKNIIEVNLCSCHVNSEGIKVLIQAFEVSKALKNLNISSNAISDDGVFSISKFLKINSTLCKLNLSDNKIRDEGTKILSEAIQVNTTLQNLNITSNMITDEGAKRLSKAIEVNKSLQELNISKNWISKEGIMRILKACTINRTLHKLVCTHNNLSKSGLAAINEYIRKENAVQIFDASWNSIATKDGQLAIDTIFHVLDINKTTFQLSGMQQTLQSSINIQQELWFADKINKLKYRREFLLCCIEESEHLNVQSANLSDMTQMGIISDGLNLNKNIIEVNLCSCHVNNEGIKVLIQAFEVSKALKNLNISSNAISDDGVLSISKFLKINSTLCKLNLSGNKIRDEGTKILSEAIQLNTTLQNLNITSNIITDKGAKRLSKAIQVNKTLQELNISKNWISKEGVMRIVEACTINRTLHRLVCTHNNLSKSGLAAINEYIRKENAVQIFDASWNTIATKDGQLVIRTAFQILDMGKITFQLSGKSDTENMEELWFCDEIGELRCRNEFLQCCIEENQHLNVVDVDLSGKIQIGIISDGLNLNKNIIEVNLCSCQVNSEGIKVLIQAVEVSKALKNLDISSNAISDDGVFFISKFLKINSTLCKLNLSGNKIRDEGTKILSEAIQLNTTLQNLNITRNVITNEGAKRFSKAIQVNKTLQELNISKNWISKEGVMRIVEACTINRTLHRLVCTHNNLSKSELAAINEYIRKENAVQIFDASWNSICIKNSQLAIKTTFHLLDATIQQKSQLSNDHYFSSQEEIWFLDEITELKYRREFLQCEHLNVALAKLSDMAQVDIISDCLKVNKKITEVHLCSSQITSEGIKVLIQAVEVSTTLQNLNISSNAISDDGVLSISNFLKINSTLCKLNLSGNKIRDKGTKILSEAIQVNTTLQNLNITSNIITDEGAKRLSKAIEVNKSLQELNISKNWISKEGVMRIVEACTINRTLHRLVCTHNNLSKSGLAAINEYIRKENAVQIFDASWNSIIASSRYQSFLICVLQSLIMSWSHDDWKIISFAYHKQVYLIDDGVWNDNIKYDFTGDSLTELNFSSIAISSNLLVGIIQQVMQIDTLQKLTAIQFNNISDDEAIVFRECLKTNTTLIELDLSWNYITDKRVSEIAEALKVNNTLQKLNISGSYDGGISNDGAIAFSECLKTNITLRELDLSGNYIIDKGASAIAEALKVNNTLQKLNISGSYDRGISDDGAIAFSECLKTNITLRELDLSWNYITDKGASAIAEALKVNNTLQTLNISLNEISDDGAMTFSECLKTNTTLIRLDMPWNNISSGIIQTITQAIKANNEHKVQNISDY